MHHNCIHTTPSAARTRPRIVLVHARASPEWPWSKKRQAVPPPPLPPLPPPPPPPPPTVRQYNRPGIGNAAAPGPNLAADRSWQHVQPVKQQQGQTAPRDPRNGLPGFSAWRWSHSNGQGQQQRQQNSQRPSTPLAQPGRPPSSQPPWAQSIPEVYGDLSDNPRWRWPQFTKSGQPQPQPQQQQQQQQQAPYRTTAAHPTPPRNQHKWPFIGGAFNPTPSKEYRQRLERMGVSFEPKQPPVNLPENFEQMDVKQFQQYMDQRQQRRLDSIQNRHDDEVWSITKIYLLFTGVILALAVFANLPS
eukprot:jgi/Chrzof1/7612/Cz02g30070.t1